MEGILLEYKFRKQQEISYNSSTTMVQLVIDKGVEAKKRESFKSNKIKQRVIETEPDGTAYIVAYVDHLREVIDGKESASLLPPEIIYFKVDRRGKILEMSGLSSQSSHAFPGEAVNEGAVWDGESIVSLPGATEPVHCLNHYTFAGFEDYCGRNCARIKISTDETSFEVEDPEKPGNVMHMVDSTGHLLVDPAEGVLCKSEINFHAISKIENIIVDTTALVLQEKVD